MSPRSRPPRTVLAVFPHPDDEAVTCAGTLHRLTRSGATVIVVMLTGGERGNAAGIRDPELKAVRTREAREVARILGISRLIQADFADGRLQEERNQVESYLSSHIQQHRPDLIITYDLSGLYGHPDHMVCSELLTGLRRSRFPDVRLWYAALPAQMLWFLGLVGQMRDARGIAAGRSTPTHAQFVGRDLLVKLRAVHAYRSQRLALGKGLGRFVPAWLMVSLQPLEYFAEVR